MNLIDFSYENAKDKELTRLFLQENKIKKYILGINKLTKSVLKHIEVDGIIDDFSRVQSSRKKDILQIQDVPKNSLILSTSTGSPLEVQNTLRKLGFDNFNYLSFLRYSKLELKSPAFIMDFKEDFIQNKKEYEKTYKLLDDEKSREVFTKIINFKISFDLSFMSGFTNNHEEQYFDKSLIPKIKNINFLDGGAYVGDTLPSIIKNFPDFNKIYCIEPNNLHINIAKRNFKDFKDIKKIEFINCGLGKTNEQNQLNDLKESKEEQEPQNNCKHDYQALNINSIDNLIKTKIDFIKLDIEGAEQETIKGAKQSILTNHPILAICIYHKAQDWYKIPQEVLKIRSDYKIYLRHYMEGIFETVMYFIPKNKFS